MSDKTKQSKEYWFAAEMEAMDEEQLEDQFDWWWYNIANKRLTDMPKEQARIIWTACKDFEVGHEELGYGRLVKRLRAENAALVEALAPFAQDGFQPTLGGNAQGDDSPVYGRERSILKLGDFRRAKAAYDNARAESAEGEK